MEVHRMREPPLSEDSAVVLALAGTAMPFADSPEGESEHWLRILRMHGEAGRTLQALGVGEKPLETTESGVEPRPRGRAHRGGENVVDLVTAQAAESAARREAACVSTVDVLHAVLNVYGHFFEDTLYSHGC